MDRQNVLWTTLEGVLNHPAFDDSGSTGLGLETSDFQESNSRPNLFLFSDEVPDGSDGYLDVEEESFEELGQWHEHQWVIDPSTVVALLVTSRWRLQGIRCLK